MALLAQGRWARAAYDAVQRGSEDYRSFARLRLGSLDREYAAGQRR